jgi:hypothetical protein
MIRQKTNSSYDVYDVCIHDVFFWMFGGIIMCIMLCEETWHVEKKGLND